MKKATYILLLVCLFAACKKNESMNGYSPKIGDSLDLLISSWGKPSKTVQIAPSFNDDTDYYYEAPYNKIITISDRSVKGVRNN